MSEPMIVTRRCAIGLGMRCGWGTCPFPCPVPLLWRPGRLAGTLRFARRREQGEQSDRLSQPQQHATGTLTWDAGVEYPGRLCHLDEEQAIMLVSWQRRRSRRHQEWSAPTEPVLNAILVGGWHSNGRAWPRTGRLLGTIHESNLGKSGQAARFWARVDGVLGEMGLDAARRSMIEREIAETVPRPTPAAVERAKQAFDARRAGILAELADPDRSRRLRDS